MEDPVERLKREAYSQGHAQELTSITPKAGALEEVGEIDPEMVEVFHQALEDEEVRNNTCDRGDILIYLGNNGEEIAVIKDVGQRGQVRVGSGDKSETVYPTSFIEIIKGTDRSRRMADYLNRK